MDPLKADVLRVKGNDFFKKGDYNKAVHSYLQGIQCDNKNSTLYSNLSQAYLSLQRYADAERQACNAIEFDRDSQKGYYRAAKGAHLLGNTVRAIQYLQAGMRRPLLSTNANLVDFYFELTNSSAPPPAAPASPRKRRDARRGNDVVAVKPGPVESSDIDSDPFLRTVESMRNENPGKFAASQGRVRKKKADLEMTMRDGSDFLLNKRLPHTAAIKYKEALDILSEYPAEVLQLGSMVETVLKYAISISWCQAGNNYQGLERSVDHLNKLRENQALRFPALFYSLGSIYVKLNRYAFASELVEEGLSIVDNGNNFESYPWPGTKIIIKETTFEGLKEALKRLRAECHVSYTPDAVCKHDCRKCQHLNAQILHSRRIYRSDPDFNGFMEIHCQSKCLIQYHLACWKDYKETFSVSTFGHKLSEKDMLGKPCPTDDCITSNGSRSVIVRIDLMSSDPKVPKFHCERDPPPPTVDKDKLNKKKSETINATPVEKEKRPKPKHRIKVNPVDRKPSDPVISARGGKSRSHSMEGDEPGEMYVDDMHSDVLENLIADFRSQQTLNNYYPEDQRWDLCKPLYGRSDLGSGKWFVHKAVDSTHEFVCSYFYELISSSGGPMTMEDVVETWDTGVRDMEQFKKIARNPSFPGIVKYIGESYRFVFIDDSIAIDRNVHELEETACSEMRECIEFLLKESSGAMSDPKPASMQLELKPSVKPIVPGLVLPDPSKASVQSPVKHPIPGLTIVSSPKKVRHVVSAAGDSKPALDKNKPAKPPVQRTIELSKRTNSAGPDENVVKNLIPSSSVVNSKTSIPTIDGWTKLGTDLALNASSTSPVVIPPVTKPEVAKKLVATDSSKTGMNGDAKITQIVGNTFGDSATGEEIKLVDECVGVAEGAEELDADACDLFRNTFRDYLYSQQGCTNSSAGDKVKQAIEAKLDEFKHFILEPKSAAKKAVEVKTDTPTVAKKAVKVEPTDKKAVKAEPTEKRVVKPEPTEKRVVKVVKPERKTSLELLRRATEPEKRVVDVRKSVDPKRSVEPVKKAEPLKRAVLKKGDKVSGKPLTIEPDAVIISPVLIETNERDTQTECSGGSKLEAKLEEVYAENRELQKRLSSANDISMMIMENCKLAEERNQQLMEEKEGLRRERGDASNRCQQLEGEKEKLEGELEAMWREFEVIAQEKGETTRRKVETEQERERLETENERLKMEKEGLERENEGLKRAQVVQDGEESEAELQALRLRLEFFERQVVEKCYVIDAIKRAFLGQQKELGHFKAKQCERTYKEKLVQLSDAIRNPLVDGAKKLQLTSMHARLSSERKSAAEHNTEILALYDHVLEHVDEVENVSEIPKIASAEIPDEVYASLVDIAENYQEQDEGQRASGRSSPRGSASVADLPFVQVKAKGKPAAPLPPPAVAVQQYRPVKPEQQAKCGQPLTRPPHQPPHQTPHQTHQPPHQTPHQLPHQTHQPPHQMHHPPHQPNQYQNIPFPPGYQHNFHQPPPPMYPPPFYGRPPYVPHECPPFMGAPPPKRAPNMKNPNIINEIFGPAKPASDVRNRGTSSPLEADAGGQGSRRGSAEVSKADAATCPIKVEPLTNGHAKQALPKLQPVLTDGTVDRTTSHTFNKLMWFLVERFPGVPVTSLQDCVSAVRKQNSNSLSGLKMDDILDRIATLLPKETAPKPAWGAVSRGDEVNWSNPMIDLECVICMEPITPDLGTKLHCNHMFHSACIKEWLDIEKVCPTCKRFVKTMDEYPPLK